MRVYGKGVKNQWLISEIKLMDDIEERMRQIQAENAARQMAEAIDEQDA